MPTLTKDTLDLLAMLGVALAAVALLLGVGAFIRLHRMRRDYDVLQDGEGRESFISVVGRQRDELRGLRNEIEAAKQELAVARAELHDAIRHVAVVRYDAFADMGGRLSFSAAMLDDSGDGLVLTSINGRSETRTYAKGVEGGGERAHALTRGGAGDQLCHWHHPAAGDPQGTQGGRRPEA